MEQFPTLLQYNLHFFYKFVTLHTTLKLKVIARSQHTHTTRLVCPEDIDMRIFNCENKGGHTCFVLEEFITLVPLFFSACFMSRLVCERWHAKCAAEHAKIR